MILVTGASGMLGYYVIKQLSEQDVSVTHLSSRNMPKYVPEHFNWSALDLSAEFDENTLDELFPGTTAIFHLGATVPRKGINPDDSEIFQANVGAVQKLASWALDRNIYFVFISGATVYKDAYAAKIKEDALLGPSIDSNFYGYSKVLAENTLEFYRSRGLELCTLRPSSIYGYGLAKEKMIRHFLGTLFQGRELELKPPTNDTINLIYADDVATAILQAHGKKVTGIFNLANKDGTSVLSIAETCRDIVRAGDIKVTEGSDKFTATKSRFNLDSTAAHSSFNFKAKYSIEQGLEDLLANDHEFKSLRV